MTKQQVIDILEAYKPSGNIYNGYNSMDYYVAFDKAINYIKWDNLKEKISQLQTYKLFQNDKKTYLNKQDIIELILNMEREVNNE